MTTFLDQAQSPVAPAARYWSRADIGPSGPLLLPALVSDDLAALQAWAAPLDDPVAEWQLGAVELPAVAELAAAIGHELSVGSGVVRVESPATDVAESTLRLFYLAIGTMLGDVAENYGRLYDVKDRGVSYRKEAVPVSMTRESTGMHTDSSARAFEPDFVGLLCIRPAPSGGRSRVVSAASAHRRLAETHPDLLERLHRPFIRDVVTPGFSRDLDKVRANAFPVFGPEAGMTFRYMRYWIESGHAAVGERLEADDIAAFDALDEALHHDDLLVEFDLAAGQQLWVANRTIAHDRSAYDDDPDAPRLMVRQWVTASV